MYPTRVKLFLPWAKAMVAGATVGKPDYGKTMSSGKSPQAGRRRRKRKRRRKSSAKKTD